MRRVCRGPSPPHWPEDIGSPGEFRSLPLQPIDAVSLLFTTLIGACVGSFLNVVVYRLPRGLSLVHPPSTCPKCDTRLKWYDNIPIFGWFKLGGRCRNCRQSISKRYPLVELATGLLFAAEVAADSRRMETSLARFFRRSWVVGKSHGI